MILLCFGRASVRIGGLLFFFIQGILLHTYTWSIGWSFGRSAALANKVPPYNFFYESTFTKSDAGEWGLLVQGLFFTDQHSPGLSGLIWGSMTGTGSYKYRVFFFTNQHSPRLPGWFWVSLARTGTF